MPPVTQIPFTIKDITPHRKKENVIESNFSNLNTSIRVKKEKSCEEVNDSENMNTFSLTGCEQSKNENDMC